eukprot:Rmarinus@m.525
MKLGPIALVGLFALSAAAPIDVAEQLEYNTGNVEILYDTWGIPHIYANDMPSLSYGYGYAQARDHGPLLCSSIAGASGRQAEYWGPFWTEFDADVWAREIPQTAEMMWHEMQPIGRDIYEAFAGGINYYIETHGDNEAFDMFAPMLPLEGLDVFTLNFRTLYEFAFRGSLSGVGEWIEEDEGVDMFRILNDIKGKHYSGYVRHDKFEEYYFPKEYPMGSNSWAVGPEFTDGGAMLVSNPHLPYVNILLWYEAHLVIEPMDIDIMGASLLGLPNIQIGTNKHLGWSHTVNTIQAYTRYEVPLVDDDHYLLDGISQEIEREEITMKIREDDGSYTEQTMIVEHTVHGTVIGRRSDSLLVVRYAGLHNENDIRPNAMLQWWEMGMAKDLDEFNAALSHLQIPMFTVMVATVDGDIEHHFHGWVADRKHIGGDHAFWSKPVDGSTTDTLWTEIHPFEDLPTLKNPSSGWLQNANDAPWTTTFPLFQLDPNDYPAYLAPGPGMSWRAQVSARLLHTAERPVNYETFVALKHSTLEEMSLHTVEELLRLAEASDNAKAKAAAAVLAQFDFHLDAESIGGPLFVEWKKLAKQVPDLFVNPWDPENPLDTPNTFAHPDLMVELLAEAYDRMNWFGFDLDAKYGDVHRILFRKPPTVLTLPGHGGPDTFRNTWYFQPVEKPVAGDSYVAVTEFKPDGTIVQKSCLIYGNASPNSEGDKTYRHIYDQGQLYANKELKDNWRTREEILEHLETKVELAYSA